MMNDSPTWIELPEALVRMSAGEVQQQLSALLVAVRGEPLAATIIPLRPDASFHVIQLNPGVNPDFDLLGFSTTLQSKLALTAQHLLGLLTPSETLSLQHLLTSTQEVNEIWGVNEEAFALVIPKRLVSEAKTRLDALFAELPDPLVVRTSLEPPCAGA